MLMKNNSMEQLYQDVEHKISKPNAVMRNSTKIGMWETAARRSQRSGDHSALQLRKEEPIANLATLPVSPAYHNQNMQ